MKPQAMIDEVKKAFGSMTGRDAELEEIFWNVLYEVETLLRPTDIAEWQELSVTDTGSWYEYQFGSEVIDVVRVQRGDLTLVNVPIEALLQLPSWTGDGVFWSFDSNAKKLILNRTTGGSGTTLRALVLEHTARVGRDQDLPILERLYPVLSSGFMLRVAELVKDMERTQLFAQKYSSLLGAGSKEEG